MGRERQIQKQVETRNNILDTARIIIKEKGINALSIRKITNQLDYSPGIIYHYFKDKNEIIDTLAIEGYEKIISSLQSRKVYDDPVLDIKEMFISYIEAALDNPYEYKTFMLSDDETILNRTAILEEGISKKSRTMQLLTELIQKGISRGVFNDIEPELTAQVIWTASFGLVMRLITEQKIPDEQKKRLIDQQFKLILTGILKK